MANWKWCVQGDDGKVIKGWYEDNGNWYLLNDQGIMQTGWIKDADNKWYYLDSNGAMKTGWLQDKGKWYYLNPISDGNKGSMYSNASYTIDGKSYKFDSTGALIEDTSIGDNAGLVSDKVVDFVKSYEGFSATHYKDAVGVDTIGYGSTHGWIMKLATCTKEQATQALKEEINNMAKQIKSDLNSKGVNLNQNQFDAICSFAYNCGVSALLGSTLYKRICQGIRDSSIKDNFTAWSKAGGQTLRGLYNRRVEEYNIFDNSDYKRDL